MLWGEVFYQNGKMLNRYFFRKYIYSFKIFSEPDTVNSEQDLFRRHKKLLLKRKYKKNFRPQKLKTDCIKL